MNETISAIHKSIEEKRENIAIEEENIRTYESELNGCTDTARIEELNCCLDSAEGEIACDESDIINLEETLLDYEN